MKYLSTRGAAQPLTFSQAALRGLAEDGGLYVPAKFPAFTGADFAGADALPDIAARALRPFLEGDPLADGVEGLCRRALSFPVPLRRLDAATWALELFHGPTAAFKDVGARFLAECFAALADGRRRTILVATSGDTGGAVAAAFHGKPDVDVVILFPKGRVSERQQKQLTCWGGNVRSLCVRGSFDDCQRLVKAAFEDGALRERCGLTSANSINIGRLLPQMAYYVASSLWHLRATGRPANFVIPTGNVGNALGALWARRIGLPVGRVVMATNANRTVPDYLRTGQWQPRASVETLANAMDVGNPSNMERVRHLFPDPADLRAVVSSVSVSDDTIRENIARAYRATGEVWCPHTAVGLQARAQQKDGDWIVVSTAHAAKFNDVVEPLIGAAVEVPAGLAALLDQPSVMTEIAPELEALRSQLA